MSRINKYETLPVETIIHLYTVDHVPFYQIAKQYRVVSSAIRNILSERGITIHRPSIPIDITELIHLYTVEHLASTEIAKHFGVTSCTILRRLREYNIPIQDKHRNPFKKNSVKSSNLHPNIKEIVTINGKRYGLSVCPICGKTRKRKLMSNTTKVPFSGKCRQCSSKEKMLPLDINIVRDLYVNQNMTTKQIANRLQVTERLIRTNMKRYHISTRPKGLLKTMVINNKGTIDSPVVGDILRGYDIGIKDKGYFVRVICPRCKKERWQEMQHSKKSHLCKPCVTKLNGIKYSGEKASAWRGGLSFEPYDVSFNNNLRQQIRDRDNHRCQLCGRPENGIKLAVHHIDYNKHHNTPENLVSLCSKAGGGCHSRTNSNREFWREFLSKLVHGRYYKRKRKSLDRSEPMQTTAELSAK